MLAGGSSLDDLNSIIKLAQETGVGELEVSVGDRVYRVVPGARSPAPAEEAPDAPAIPKGTEAVRSPADGVFHRAEKEGGQPYVKAGEQVCEGETVGDVKASETVHHVEAPCRGTVHAILVEDAQEVKLGQQLMVFVPTSPGPAL